VAEPDLYAVLQVDPRAEPEIIEAAYRRLARKWHPDANPDPAAGARMRELNAAYAVLGDPARRRAYDAVRAGEGGGGLPAAERLPRAVTTGLLVVAALVAVRLLAGLGRAGLVVVVLAGAAYWWLRRRKRPE
jgi:curved DNA-binding protein CbpA